MIRRYGRAPRGQRVRGYAPAGHWKISTFIAGLAPDGIIAPFVVDQPMNRAIFSQYVRQSLAHQLKPAYTVLLDNPSSHKDDYAAALTAERGVTLVFLPHSSPNLTPNQLAFPPLNH